MNDKVIVTGANGFIGTHLCRELSIRGSHVFAVVREDVDTTAIDCINGITVVYCDMAHYDRLKEIVGLSTIDTVYHLAWQGSSGSERANYSVQVSNVKAAMELVSSCSSLGCKRFVGAGTLAEKDVIRYAGEDGATPNAVSCYGTAKLSAHYMTKAECNNNGIEHIWVNIGNVYGRGDKSSNFINYVINVFLNGMQPDFTSGEQLYDFVYVEDVARALVEVGKSGKNNYNYYIGSGRPRLLKEYIKIVRDTIDPSLDINFGAVPFNGRSADLEDYSIEKIINDTGFNPRMKFEDGIKDRIKEAKEQKCGI